MKSTRNWLLLILLLTRQAVAQSAAAAYPNMAPVQKYLMPRDEEIELARSAAPKSVSSDAEVLVFTEKGFQPAMKGTNGFVCMVARSWSADFDDPDFWDPKLRAPNCYNALAAKSQVAVTIKRTQAVLAGASPAQVREAVKKAIDSGELPTADPGSMSYMLAKGGYLSNRSGHWLPHLMFFTPGTDPKAWGAGSPESPIRGVPYPEEHLTIFLIPLARWSDGTPAMPNEH